jgi:hypothetical protein
MAICERRLAIIGVNPSGARGKLARWQRHDHNSAGSTYTHAYRGTKRTSMDIGLVIG